MQESKCIPFYPTPPLEVKKLSIEPFMEEIEPVVEKYEFEFVVIKNNIKSKNSRTLRILLLKWKQRISKEILPYKCNVSGWDPDVTKRTRVTEENEFEFRGRTITAFFGNFKLSGFWDGRERNQWILEGKTPLKLKKNRDWDPYQSSLVAQLPRKNCLKMEIIEVLSKMKYYRKHNLKILNKHYKVKKPTTLQPYGLSRIESLRLRTGWKSIMPGLSGLWWKDQNK